MPATCAILGGKLCVGMEDAQLDYLARTGTKVIKASRRDYPASRCKELDGATTVTGTMILAAMAGVRIHATGGIGGVHRGAQQTMDISADWRSWEKRRLPWCAQAQKAFWTFRSPWNTSKRAACP